jgi:hypothetical protein
VAFLHRPFGFVENVSISRPCEFHQFEAREADSKKELIVTEKKEIMQADRKAWVQPELKQISAGSAETGMNQSPDAGPLGNAQS